MNYKEKSKKSYEELIKDIIKTKNSIREKVRALKSGRLETEIQLERMFKPVTKPLKELVANIKQEPIINIKPEPKEEEESLESLPEEMQLKKESSSTPFSSTPLKSAITDNETFGTPLQSETMVEKDLFNLSTGLFDIYSRSYFDKNSKIDNIYGPYFENNTWKIGNSEIKIREDKLMINEKEYQLTMGLCELLFMKQPLKSIYTDEDLLNYQSILSDTYAYRRDYNPDEQIKGNKGAKYKEIIKPAIQIQGKGLKLPKLNVNYIYWDDTNELVDRLRLLIASQQAGNNSHTNEILSIIEELREADIIV